MQEGNPTCCESPASLKGGSHNAGTLKRDSETRGEHPQEAAQRHGERRTDSRIQSKGKWTEVPQACKARSQPDWRGRRRDAGGQSRAAASAAALDSSGPGCVRGRRPRLGSGPTALTAALHASLERTPTNGTCGEWQP